MSIVKLNTGFNIEVEFQVASFIKRLAAYLLDVAILVGYLILGAKFFSITLGEGWSVQYPLLYFLFGLPFLFYGLTTEVLLQGQTVGKRIMGIRVITIEGGQPTLSQYLIRWMFTLVDLPYWLLYAISSGGWPWFCFFFLFAGLISFIITSKSQRVGDVLAGTMVINTQQGISWEDTVFTAVEENYTPLFPQVMQMTDRDMNTLKQVLKTAKSNRDYEYANRIVFKIKSALHIDTDMDAFDFMEVLLKDYNYLSSR
jgi:uncharacterized RDD family membrane protein YckC